MWKWTWVSSDYSEFVTGTIHDTENRVYFAEDLNYETKWKIKDALEEVKKNLGEDDYKKDPTKNTFLTNSWIKKVKDALRNL